MSIRTQCKQNCFGLNTQLLCTVSISTFKMLLLAGKLHFNCPDSTNPHWLSWSLWTLEKHDSTLLLNYYRKAKLELFKISRFLSRFLCNPTAVLQRKNRLWKIITLSEIIFSKIFDDLLIACCITCNQFRKVHQAY